MWSHTDRAPSSQISRSTAHGAHKRPGHNWKCQNQYWWQALIKLNMFPSGEGRGQEGRGGWHRGPEWAHCLGSVILGASLAMHATVTPPWRAFLLSFTRTIRQSNKIGHHPSNFLWFNCEAKLRWVLARNAWSLLLLTYLLLTLMQL